MITGEFDLIAKIRRQAGTGPEQRLGIGDDCSLLEIPTGFDLLTSTDLLLEAIHFNLEWTDLSCLGHKAVAVNVSDIAAMGGRARCLYLGLGLPEYFEEAQVESFMRGFAAALQEYGVFLAGGDTCRSADSLTLAVTVQGLCPTGRCITRSGAQPGDDLWVSGTLGDSALALQRLKAGISLTPFLAKRHFRPCARAELGKNLGDLGLATAMLDLSDGLAGDLRHLVHASGVGARIEQRQLPQSADFAAAVRQRPDLIELALVGGEDYELLFAAQVADRANLKRLSATLQLPLTRIGAICSGADIVLVTDEGVERELELGGFDHFASAADVTRG